jgi:hypothetical protein
MMAGNRTPARGSPRVEVAEIDAFAEIPRGIRLLGAAVWPGCVTASAAAERLTDHR